MLCCSRSVINDRIECLDALIENNVDPNVVFMGETALSIAARQNRDKIMGKLLNYSKTKKDVQNEMGGTVLHFAAAGFTFIDHLQDRTSIIVSLFPSQEWSIVLNVSIF